MIMEKKYKYFFVSIKKKNVIEFCTSQKQTHYMYNKLNFFGVELNFRNLIWNAPISKNLIYNIKRGINR